MLSNASDEDMQVALDRTSPAHLFFGATQSKATFNIIRRYFDLKRSHHFEEEEPEMHWSKKLHSSSCSPLKQMLTTLEPQTLCGFQTLPPELGIKILEQANYATRSCMAQTCLYAAALVADLLEFETVKLLHRFSLIYHEIRLMQTVTSSVIAGALLVALCRPDIVFQFTELEIVTPQGKGALVVRFLLLATEYETVVTVDSDCSAVNVDHLWTLQLGHHKILVLEANTDNPLDVLARRPLSCLYGALTAKGLWMGYPQLTASGVMVTTPSRFSAASDIASHRKMWHLMQLYLKQNFFLSLKGNPLPHVCGVDVSCPATLRTNTDTGCLSSSFPRWTYSKYAKPLPTVCWSMGGEGCSNGDLMKDITVLRTLSNAVLALNVNLFFAKLDLPVFHIFQNSIQNSRLSLQRGGRL
ncbi:hypothetical protein R3P38DRAFT_2764895 [Favolaschia claudopus]|uniref:Uncharacterized protein n=1 Tax=Favolaschia claudopus TaxID=2862362 RepID=A0AAW0DDW6_9AGAR